MRSLISITLAFLLSGACLADQVSSSPFCIVPIQSGAPTEKDHNQAWRMVDKIVTLPGVPRPIIYAVDRGGVWTIDENRAFVPFGGEFPFNIFSDKIARDPNTGRFVGVDAGRGVFELDPGQTQFTKLYGLGGSSLRHPYSVEFVPRFDGFVIADPSGLYLLDHTGALKQLPAVSHPASGTPFAIFDQPRLKSGEPIGIPFAVFDLPSFNALLIDADIQGPALVVRYDDGQAVLVTTLGAHDFVRSVTVEADGSVTARSQFDHRTVRLSRTPSTPVIQGKSFVVKESPVHVGMARLDAPAIGKVIVREPNSGLAELGPSGPVPIALPFDPVREPIEAMVEMPKYKAVLIITDVSAYALQDNGTVSEIRRAREAGVSPITASRIELIPVRNETIFLGRNSLNLLVDTRISGEAACNLGYVPAHR
jgi:hypothetical protein